MATLLVTLILMTSITMLTLAVASTRRTEQVINANDIWNTRLNLAAETGMAKAASDLESDNSIWIYNRNLQQQASVKITTPGDQSIEIRTRLSRPAYQSGPVRFEIEATRNDGSGQFVQISQYGQPLSALNPAAEKAPPLVVNGCISSARGALDAWPALTDASGITYTSTGPAIWGNQASGCTPPVWIDMHSGHYVPKHLDPDLWLDIFSISREQFESLATADQQLTDSDRLYWMAHPSELVSGRWTKSLGSPVHPVILYIPQALGCPEFSPGVRIFGIIFIDAACTTSTNTFELELFGILAINGNLSVHSISLRLSHLQTVDPLLRTLIFPALRTVWIPGTWRDF